MEKALENYNKARNEWEIKNNNFWEPPWVIDSRISELTIKKTLYARVSC